MQQQAAVIAADYGAIKILGDPPAPLRAAINSLECLHSTYDRLPGATVGDSSRSCVFSATTVRDVLRRQGFDARCAPVTVAMCSHKDGKRTDLAVGAKHNRKLAPGKWNGHLVTICDDYLIDMTLYGYGPPEWRGPRGMMAVRLRPPGYGTLLGLTILAHLRTKARDGYEFEILWLDNPANTRWLAMRDAHPSWSHRQVVDKLIAKTP